MNTFSKAMKVEILTGILTTSKQFKMEGGEDKIGFE
jgi:hypothetical protein